MSDNQAMDGTDRTAVSLDEEREVDAFADRHSLPKEAAIEIIRQARGNRVAADELAKNYTARA
ncbi:hypothetical protein CYG48_06255 [Neorhizobium sp. SOG26]|uniref:hypothetical protein n=1 Tax=Neorhizobium sp. SOG26 TaxID=2060726 RepID=UPI000E597432|nr:hypothetical protein [Neorhizobium sp. SOG26]AXV15335.1 hypothetical protein CYG48_06255 [Neorhizobium sp. SOG26]